MLEGVEAKGGEHRRIVASEHAEHAALVPHAVFGVWGEVVVVSGSLKGVRACQDCLPGELHCGSSLGAEGSAPMFSPLVASLTKPGTVSRIHSEDGPRTVL